EGTWGFHTPPRGPLLCRDQVSNPFVSVPVQTNPTGLTGNLGGLAMKKFLLGSVGLAAMLAGPAMAADMRVAPPPPPVVYYDWSGAYVGGNIGGVWYDVNRSYPNAVLGIPGLPASFQTSDSNAIFGFHAGAQWQWGAWVLGVEAALSGCTNECRSYAVLP